MVRLLDLMTGTHPPAKTELAENRRTTLETTSDPPRFPLGARVVVSTEARTPFFKIL